MHRFALLNLLFQNVCETIKQVELFRDKGTEVFPHTLCVSERILLVEEDRLHSHHGAVYSHL